jgi:hypothetical protein
MEWPHEMASPRPKGFLRRRWVALVFGVGFLVSSVLDGFVEVTIGQHCFAAGMNNGAMGWATYLRSSQSDFESQVTRFHEPKLGTWFKFFTHADDETDAILVPIWCPLIVVIIWIMAREGWRKPDLAP